MVLLRRRDWAGGAGPAVEAPRTDFPRSLLVPPPAVEVGAGAAALVAVGSAAEVVALEEGIFGFLNRLLNGAVEVAVGAVDEVGA